MIDLKTVWRAASAAVVVGLVAVALVACGGAAFDDIPTTVVSSSDEGGTVSASDLTTAGTTGDAETSDDGWGQGPPEALLAACTGLSAEAACSFTSPLDGSTVDGACRASRHDPSQYVCLPSDWDGRGPGHGRHGAPEEALAACEGIATGAACSFEATFGTVEGTCSEGSGTRGRSRAAPTGSREAAPGTGASGTRRPRRPARTCRPTPPAPSKGPSGPSTAAAARDATGPRWCARRPTGRATDGTGPTTRRARRAAGQAREAWPAVRF